MAHKTKLDFFSFFFDFPAILVSIFKYYIQHCFTRRPADSTVSEDAGNDPKTVATFALAVSRSSHSG
jgi:hypothetical protein